MQREPPPTDPGVEALLDQRDQLQIQISLAADAPDADMVMLAALGQRLAQLEIEIERH